MAFFNGQPGVGGALTQPQVPVGQAQPEKIGLWQRFRDKLASDPNLRMALMTTGNQMLKTPQPGQSGFDIFSDAAQAGIGTLDTLRQRDRRQGLEDKDRAFRQDATTQQLGMQEQQVAQGGERLDIARGQLAEGVRQFQAKLQAGNFRS